MLFRIDFRNTCLAVVVRKKNSKQNKCEKRIIVQREIRNGTHHG